MTTSADYSKMTGLKFVTATFLVLASLTVFGTNSSNDGSVHCYKGHTGANTGGSCTFDKGMCSWTNFGYNNSGWKIKESESMITMSTFQRNESETGHLVSPLMCEISRVDLCLKFRYRILNNNGRGMTFFLRCINTCDRLSEWTVNSSVVNVWQDAHFTFKSPGNFQMIIEARKLSGYHGSENDFQIDDVVYFNTACNTSHAIAPPTSSAGLTKTSSLTTPEVHTLSEIVSYKYQTGVITSHHRSSTSPFFLMSSTKVYRVSSSVSETFTTEIRGESSTFTSNLPSATHSTSAPGTPVSGKSSTFTSNFPSTAHPTNAPGTSVAEVNTTHGKTTTTFYNTSTLMTSVSNVAGKGVDHTLGIVVGSLAIGLGAAVLIIVIVFRLRRRPGTHNPDNQREGTTIMIMNEIYVST